MPWSLFLPQLSRAYGLYFPLLDQRLILLQFDSSSQVSRLRQEHKDIKQATERYFSLLPRFSRRQSRSRRK